MRKRSRLIVLAGTLACLFLMATFPAAAQYGAKNGEWRTYGGDLGSTRYSPLDQINAANFKDLEVAWRFKADNLGPRPEFNFEGTPLMVNGVVYTTAGTRRAVVALDAATGEMLWMHGENEGKRADLAPRKLSGRGLAYWTDGREARIYYVTIGYRLVALDAKTGVPVAGFGNNGIVDLRQEDDQDMDLVTADIGYHAAPVVAKDTVIVGAAHSPGGVPKSRKNVKGFVRGYDARTGKRLWIFHTIPMAGEFGLDTWQNDSWSFTGNTGVWGQITVDEDAGVVYLPVETPTGDYYGGHRPGNGLFGETLVALDLKTGRRLWHYQFIHHGIWDWDIPCAPILTDITVGGRRIKAVSQPTKQAWIYTFDRTNGKPVWPIEERPVPQSDVPTEKTSATQPFPTKPPAFDRQGVTADDLIDFTPELHAAALELVSHYKLGPIFTPAVVSKADGPLATLMMPSATGGANWQGGSFDPETGILYVFSDTNVTALGLVKPDASRSDMDYIAGSARRPNPNAQPGGGGRGRGGAAAGRGAAGGGGEGEGGGGLNVQGLPLIKPPYGRITAIDMNKGEILWQIAHGETPDNIKNNPALKGLTIPRTGRQGRIGTLVTKTLVVAGEGGFFTTPSGARGAMLRAYDKATGKEAGAVYMPAPQTGSPMTYMLNGKQYIVVAISGGSYSAELIAFRLGS
ncbi:MAG TPA: pyrroloquinoline quinone-dependent dehydrogenase [Bryobacteraceae bacterium]|nr:pyrroloquinoline quinone-dependent dehydrogenase [Bryobacteraceae bacterium]